MTSKIAEALCGVDDTVAAELLESFLMASQDAVGVFSADGRLAWVNPAFHKLFGWATEDILGLSCADLPHIPEDMREEALHTIRKVFCGEAIRIPRSRRVCKSGTVLQIELTLTPLRTSDGEIVGVSSVLRDRTVQWELDQALAKTRGQLDHFVANSVDAICIFDRELRVVTINRGCLELLRKLDLIVSTGDLLYQHLRGLRLEFENERRLEQALAGETFKDVEQTVILADGSRVEIVMSIFPLHDAEQVVYAVACIAHDVTHERESRSRLRHAHSLVGLGHYEYDIRRDYLYFSDEMYRIFCVSPEKFGHSYQEVAAYLHPGSYSPLYFWENSFETSFEDVFRIVRGDGEARWVHRIADVQRTASGEPVRVFGTVRDVTDEHEAKRSVKEHKDRLTKAEALAHIGHWQVDPAKPDVYLSAEMYRILGREVGSRVSREDIAESIHVDDRSEFIRQLSEPGTRDGQLRVIQPDGDTRHLLVRTETRFVGDNAIGEPSLFGVAHDVTEQMRAHQMLQASQEHLRHQEKLLLAGQLAAGVAHEIRNPLTALKGFTQLLHQGARLQEDRYYRIMLGELVRIENIINELLVLAKPQVASFTDSFVIALLQDVLTLTRVQASMHNVVIETDLADAHLAAVCDPNQIKQVFLNVVQNAFEAMPQGGTLMVTAAECQGEIIVAFRDTGVGMTADQLRRVGEPFFTTKE
ncbi:MAG: PAS domain S-box protein, partial [Firmicutes bacterium]|nr:PAS domain S-box protein [Bacillota bacterium]